MKIWTDDKDFERKVNSIIAGGQDYPPKTKEENEYFKSAVLSQDGIDNFLKADNDKERYSKFIADFGDENLANYYNNIDTLEKENNNKIKEIGKNKLAIEKVLKKPIDEEVFSFSNQKIEELNKNDLELALIDDSFDKVKKIEFENKLNEQKLKLNKQVEYNTSLKKKLPKWIEDSNKYFKNKQDWNESKNKLIDYEKLNRCNLDIELLKQIQIDKKALKLRLEKLKIDYPSYKIILDEINRNEIFIQEKQKQVIKLEIDKSALIDDYEKLEKEVKKTEKQKVDIDILILDISKYYNEIEALTSYINESKKNLNDNNKIKENINNLENNKLKLISIKEDIKNNIFLDIKSDELYKNKVLDIEKLLEKNHSFKTQLDLVQKDEEKYKEYDSQLNNLLSIGMNIIDKNDSETCPLCHTKQESYDILKDKILNNPFLEKLEQELLKKKNSITTSMQENNKKIEIEKNVILFDYDIKIADIKTEIIGLNHKEKKIDTEKLEQNITKKEQLLSKTEHKSKEEFLNLKVKEQSDIQTQLENLYKSKENKEETKIIAIDNFNTLEDAIKNIQKNIDELKSKKIYTSIINWISNLQSSDNILEQLNNSITDIDKLLNDNNEKLNKLNDEKEQLKKKLKIFDTKNIDMTMEELKDDIFKLKTEIMILETAYEKYFSNKINNKDTIQEDINKKSIELDDKLKSDNDMLISIEVLEKNSSDLLQFIENQHKKKELEKLEADLELKNKVSKKLDDERKKVETKIENDVKAFFQEDLINQIYEKIDPHPDYKKVKFECSFEKGTGKLNIFVNDEYNNKHTSPSLYYSTAQLNVLSLSIFLAKALNVKTPKGENVDCIFIDDPIQSMDSINILSTIDLLRSLVVNFNKQIILSTHDENFHKLLQKKIPAEYFDSKFIELETFGKIKIKK